MIAAPTSKLLLTNAMFDPEGTKSDLTGRRAATVLLPLLLIAAIATVAHLSLDSPMLSRATMLAAACLVLWLFEVIPLYATTLVLWTGMVLLLAPLNPAAFSLTRVTSSAINPVMILFFGGFVLSVAAAKYGIDAYIAGWMIKASGGRKRALLLTVMSVTAVLSMWMLNTAAAAMMLATLRPLFAADQEDHSFRAAMLLGLAMGANFGGIGTPIGTGPNLIAIGAIESHHHITFIDWMIFAVPLAILMVALSYVLLLWLYRVSGSMPAMSLPRAQLSWQGWCIVGIFSATVGAWLLEPVHHIPSALIAIAMAAVLFGTRLLEARDLRLIGWDTLLLIAGGLTLGQLFDDSGLARAMAGGVSWDLLPPAVLILGLVCICAIVSAVSSNTAASAIIIQIAMGIAPSPITAVLVALGASMGMPFVISTPPNALVYGEGGLRPRDFLVPGLILMVIGCVLIAMTGPMILRWFGMA
jgi:solute carrier family 13 (sodium-dependent dicarboxylate transporter), member 2/3/5